MSRAPSQPVTLPEGTIRDFAAQLNLDLGVHTDRAILRKMRVRRSFCPCTYLLYRAKPS